MRGLRRYASYQAGRLLSDWNPVQVLVRDNNVDQALRVLKKKMQREGVFREMKQRRAYEKPSERRTREKAEAVRRARKLARKQAQREGLLPMPARKARPTKPRPAESPAATGTNRNS
jgi:small subunit ribosomal protein S21